MEDRLRQPVSVDDECAREISGIVILFRRLSFVYILWIIITAVHQIYRILKTADDHYIRWDSIFIYKIYPYLYLVQLIFGACNTYFFFRAFSMQKAAVSVSDDVLFADSYRVFKKGILLWVGLTLLALIEALIFAYLEVKNL